tara:strand:+ start:2895 stop:3041 length:147 start_codon:yes stop_codon:yes gene_type:complete
MAWWLLHDVLNGTLDDEYPIKEIKSRELSLTTEGSGNDSDSEYESNSV